MKNLLVASGFVFLAFYFTACAHETTTMDRELALKIVERTGRIEIVQTGGSPLLGPAGGHAAQGQVPPMDIAGQDPTAMLNKNDGQSHICRSQPILDLNGNYMRTSVVCY